MRDSDYELINAIERGDIEMQPMGTTTRYFNAWAPRGAIHSTAGGHHTLREILSLALGDVSGARRPEQEPAR